MTLTHTMTWLGWQPSKMQASCVVAVPAVVWYFVLHPKPSPPFPPQTLPEPKWEVIEPPFEGGKRYIRCASNHSVGVAFLPGGSRGAGLMTLDSGGGAFLPGSR